MRKQKNLLEDYTVEVTYSTNKKESDEILRRLAHYLIQFGIKEKTLPLHLVITNHLMSYYKHR